MIHLDYTPIEVELNVEQGNLTSDAFYTVGFITMNDTAPRTLVVTSLQDLLDNGYLRGSEAYNFCKGVFIQGQMNTVVVRAVRSNETYSQAYLADDNSNYYFVVIGSKNTQDVLTFNDTLASENAIKLQFFSSNVDVSEQCSGRKLVFYYYDHDTGNPLAPIGFQDFPMMLWDSRLGVQLDSGTYIYLSPYDVYTEGGTDTSFEGLIKQTTGEDLTYEQAQSRGIKYAEGAWIGLCGNYFPSQTQWLYKRLNNVDASTYEELKDIPDLSTASVYMPRTLEKSTLGSGKTCQGFPIHEVVGLDWVKYALQKKLWEVFYTSEKVPATNAGVSLLENAVRYVLDIAVQQEIFTDYVITGRKLLGSENRASFSFEATLTQTILEVKKVEGTIYH